MCESRKTVFFIKEGATCKKAAPFFDFFVKNAKKLQKNSKKVLQILKKYIIILIYIVLFWIFLARTNQFSEVLL